VGLLGSSFVSFVVDECKCFNHKGHEGTQTDGRIEPRATMPGTKTPLSVFLLLLEGFLQILSGFVERALGVVVGL
jgi:hypothetical protein